MTTDKKLGDIRKRIDEIDNKLIQLISDRANLAAQIAEIKKSTGSGKSFYRPEREAQILKRVIKENRGPLSDDEIGRLFRELISACLALEQTLTIAYLGPEGTFTHAATLKHFGHSINTVSMPVISQVFHQVQSGACDYGVVPIENSIEGVVNHTLDMLINSNLKICGEVELRIHQFLMSKNKSRKSIRKIFSHQHSFAQCRNWLETHFPGVELIPVNSNAEAARLAKQSPGTAAIAGEATASLYNLNILDKNIEDEPDNSTLFIIIAKEDIPATGDDKTSLFFSMPSKPGALLQMLQCFADYDINMTRIESRPSRQGLWDYVFFVDIQGHVQDENIAAALGRLKSEASMVKILGSYPRAVL